MKDRYSFKTLFVQISKQKSDFWRTNLYGILTTLLLLPVPMLIPLLIDEILLNHPGRMTRTINRFLETPPVWAYIVIILTLILLLRFLAFIFNNRKTYYAIKISQSVSRRLRHHILNHLEKVSLAEYETLKSGGIAAKTVQDVESVSSFAGQVVTTVLSSSLMLAGVAIIMLKMNWILALLVFMLNPLFLGFSKILGRKTGELLLRQHEAYQLYHELLNETLELFIQVRAGNQESSFFGLLRRRATDIEQTSLDYGYRAQVTNSSSALLTSTVVDLFRALGIAAVIYSDLTIGMMIAFLFYLSTLVSPIQQLMGLVISYQATKPGLVRINSLLSLAREPDYPQLADPFKGRSSTSVELKNINFSYGDGNQVLHDISLRAKSGQKIALIGPSGGGKTTIAQIMVGFYQPQKGEILYGDTSIKNTGLPLIRKNVALMLQQALFFNDTIRMNLDLTGNKDDQQIFKALSAAQLDIFVHHLKDGLKTRIGKNGIRLSGGQRQRLAIARLILSEPKIVIFDEATSALDNRTEYNLYETLEPFLKNRTTIIIAHRTTTIRQAEHIYLVEDGRIKEEGSYQNLQERGMILEDFDT